MREGFQVVRLDPLWEERCSHSTPMPKPQPRTWPGRWTSGLTNRRRTTSGLVSLHEEEETPETSLSPLVHTEGGHVGDSKRAAVTSIK